ncbi:MAG TPA: 30S ribosomal protein S12 methylthiotransferase RimO [Planctomycetes bacterium]|nr:30S ribosomal protein S12 methylthiotransferase RimO [Planctomycetota bacterium]
MRPLAIATVSLGCAKNLIDTEVFLARLAGAGAVLTDDPRAADVVLVNTCGFIDDAVAESVAALARLVALGARGKPKPVIAVGCLPQRLGAEIFERVPGLAGAVGLDDERALPELVMRVVRGGKVACDARPSDGPAAADTPRLRLTPPHWAYLQVSEGCNAGCTFCAIPRIRGALRSKPLRAVVREARELAASGARELVLIAQDLTAYGEDLGGRPALPDLLAALERVPGIVWLRLLYLHPRRITGELIDRIAASEKILPCLDLPFQHSEPRILRRMGRGAPAEGSAGALIARLRTRIPPLVVRGTFLAGFPGETAREFAALERFVAAAGIARGGAFSFSPQAGTPAARFPDRTAPRVARARAARLRRLISENARAFARSRVGRTMTVIVDGPAGRFLAARSFAEAPEVDPVVRLPLGSAEPGTFVTARITGAAGLDLAGAVLENA